ncbi:hypothetical protein BIV25_01045 [Streptomyces sp. MUSC 14]|uniref:hypothetical protein n=1 Tax=Streptomyces sp. MUSC 14 TaxID=1354889 RepID=UPI0008F5C234|nr:hypothetical protein [Streptomyces sp. MUSC 14]OIK02825.1 hypothetical protein BIV25_01045 [Streptomyces sp. MUSC 14]
MTDTGMTQPTLPALSEEPRAEDVILGVDTHKDVHVAAVVTALGALLAHQEFPVAVNCSPGHALSVFCVEQEWNAQASTERH